MAVHLPAKLVIKFQFKILELPMPVASRQFQSLAERITKVTTRYISFLDIVS